MYVCVCIHVRHHSIISWQKAWKQNKNIWKWNETGIFKKKKHQMIIHKWIHKKLIEFLSNMHQLINCLKFYVSLQTPWHCHCICTIFILFFSDDVALWSNKCWATQPLLCTRISFHSHICIILMLCDVFVLPQWIIDFSCRYFPLIIQAISGLAHRMRRNRGNITEKYRQNSVKIGVILILFDSSIEFNCFHLFAIKYHVVFESRRKQYQIYKIVVVCVDSNYYWIPCEWIKYKRWLDQFDIWCAVLCWAEYGLYHINVWKLRRWAWFHLKETHAERVSWNSQTC